MIVDDKIKDEKKIIRKNRRINAKIYPIYKMFSWDLLFFYSIQFLFYVITKKVTASEILIINGLYLLSRILGQIPAVMITDFLGKKKSMILGNICLIIHLLMLIFIPGSIGIVFANIFMAVGYDMKLISESNLLYDSVATKGGNGLYSKLDTKGGSMYYILDGIASLLAGYLFVINNYLPIIICLIFVVISTILSFRFKEIYKKEKKNMKNGLVNNLKEYNKDLTISFKFILKSRRMKAFILFAVVFYSLIKIIDTYHGELLLNLGVPEEQFSMIFAAMTLISGISLSVKESVEKKLKNRTLTFISLMYVGSCIVIGTISSASMSVAIIPIILLMYVIHSIGKSMWYILETKYLKNFTTEEMRNKLTFTYELLGGVAASISSVIAGLLLKVVNIQNAFLITGLLWLIFIVLVLDYMRKRFGLKPEEYTKEDIEF